MTLSADQIRLQEIDARLSSFLAAARAEAEAFYVGKTVVFQYITATTAATYQNERRSGVVQGVHWYFDYGEEPNMIMVVLEDTGETSTVVSSSILEDPTTLLPIEDKPKRPSRPMGLSASDERAQIVNWLRAAVGPKATMSPCCADVWLAAAEAVEHGDHWTMP